MLVPVHAVQVVLQPAIINAITHVRILAPTLVVAVAVVPAMLVKQLKNGKMWSEFPFASHLAFYNEKYPSNNIYCY